MVDHFKRKNSFGILYLNKEKANTVEVFGILNKINVDIQDVYGVQQVGPSKIIVKLEDSASYKFERLLKDYEERIILVEERNVSVQIINVSSSNTVVTIKNAPFELSNDALADILSEYGQVYNLRTQRYTTGELAGKYNGNKTALMRLNKPIPSSLLFRRLTLLFYYRGQVRTCLKCGHVGHIAALCDTDRFDVINRIDETEFPELIRKPHQLTAVVPSSSTQSNEVSQVAKEITPMEDLNEQQEESLLALNEIPAICEPNPQSNTGLEEKEPEHHANDDVLQPMLLSAVQQSGEEISMDLMNFVAEALTPINQEELTCPSYENTVLYDHKIQDERIKVTGDSSPDGFRMNILDVEVHAAASVKNPITDADLGTTWTNDHMGASGTQNGKEVAMDTPLNIAPPECDGVVATECAAKVSEDVIPDIQKDWKVVEKKKKKQDKLKMYNMRHTTRDGGIRREAVAKRKNMSQDVKLGRFKGLATTSNQKDVQMDDEPITVSLTNDKCN